MALGCLPSFLHRNTPDRGFLFVNRRRNPLDLIDPFALRRTSLLCLPPFVLPEWKAASRTSAYSAHLRRTVHQRLPPFTGNSTRYCLSWRPCDGDRESMLEEIPACRGSRVLLSISRSIRSLRSRDDVNWYLKGTRLSGRWRNYSAEVQFSFRECELEEFESEN